MPGAGSHHNSRFDLVKFNYGLERLRELGLINYIYFTGGFMNILNSLVIHKFMNYLVYLRRDEVRIFK